MNATQHKAEAMLAEFEADPAQAVRDAHFAWLDRFANQAAQAWEEPPLRAAAPLQALAELCWARGRAARAHEIANRASAILQRHLPVTDAERLRGLGRRATWHALAGNWSAAERLMSEASAALESDRGHDEADVARARAVVDSLRAEVDYERGAFEAARRHTVQGLARLDDGLDPQPYRGSAPRSVSEAAGVALELWSQRFAIELALGCPAAARAGIDRALERWGASVGPSARRCIEARRITLALHGDDLDGAAKAWVRCFEGGDDDVPLGAVLDGAGRRAAAVRDQLEGMIAQRRSEHARAVAAFERAVSHRRPRLGRGGLFDPSEDLGFAPLERALMAVSLAHVGRGREAETIAGEGLELSRRVPLRRDLRLVILRSYGEVMAAIGELGTARAALEDAHTQACDRFGDSDPRVRRVAVLLERLA